WPDLMIPYLNKKNSTTYDPVKPEVARSVLPPTLIREGEKVRPDWLYRFLLNPTVIRPFDPDPDKSYMRLRMPKFNLSSDQAQARVNCFTAAARTSNPGAGVTAPFAEVPQKDKDYWRRQVTGYAEYVRGLPAQLKATEQQLRKEIDALK